MPWFHHRSDDEKRDEDEQRRREIAQEQDRQASLASLQGGGIPVPAQRRLDELRRREETFFTSDLSVNEFALARQAGFRPVTQVMGSSVYHVGWQRTPGQGFMRFSVAYTEELAVVSQAMNHARGLALGRLMEETERVGANGVIGVRVTRSEYEWAADMIEFQMVGTAVRSENVPKGRRPFLTNLSGQDFWKLFQSGYWPVGVVAGSTVFYVVGGWAAQMANNSFWMSRQNMEITEFAQGVSLARHRAMGLVYDQARSLQASGVVGMSIEQGQKEHKVDLGNDQERTDMICTFHAIGTGIVERDNGRVAPDIRAVVSLNG